MERHMDYRKFKSINRRELLRLTPVVALGAFAIPKVQEPLLNTGLAFSDWASKVLFRSPAGQPRNGLELVAFFLWHRNRGHGPGGYIRISIGHRMAHDFSDAYHRSAARGSRIHQGRSAATHPGQSRRTDSPGRSLSQSFFRGRQCGDLSGRRLGVGAGTMVARLRGDESWVLKVDWKYFAARLSAAMALGRIFVGLIGRRVDSIRLMLGCCWTSVVLFLLACFAPWPAVALAASIAVGLAGSCLWPTTLGVAADRFPQGGATMFGLLAAFGNL